MSTQANRPEGAKASAELQANQKAKLIVYPDNYWDYDGLYIYYKNVKDCSIDDAGAKKYKRTANAPLTYVKTLEADLITLGYLAKGNDDGHFDGASRRALLRFQRHARRSYRMTSDGRTLGVQSQLRFAGESNGICDPRTADQVRYWIDNSYVIPIGYFDTVSVANGQGRMRFDAAQQWESLRERVTKLGGTIDGPYGDTLRPWLKKIQQGVSGYSFHYTGRAVDLNQDRGGGKAQRYYVVKEPVGGELYWRIFCKTDLQDGTQGTLKNKGDVKCWLFPKTEYDIPAGYYFDLTGTIEGNSDFCRIKAHSNYETVGKAAEWWHFQYSWEIQETIQDELELIGHTEAQIRAHFGTDARMDHKPG